MGHFEFMPPESENVTNQVLRMIAERQRKMHEENRGDLRDIKAEIRAAIGQISDFGGSLKLLSHRVDEIEEHIQDEIDPVVESFQSGRSQVQGAGKLAKVIWPLICAAFGAVGAYAFKAVSLLVMASPIK